VCVSNKGVHNDEFHALETESGLYNDRQYGQEPVGAEVVNKPSTSNGTGVLPISESRSRSVGSTTERDNKTSNDQYDYQDDLQNPCVVSDIIGGTNMKISLFIRLKQNSDSPKYRTPNKLKEIMTTRITAI
jgi:hypothetical protein